MLMLPLGSLEDKSKEGNNSISADSVILTNIASERNEQNIC